MDTVPHEVTRGLEYQAVAGDAGLAGKSGRDDFDPVVAALAGAGVAGMTVRVVLNGECKGGEYGKPFAQVVDHVGAHAGSTFLNGLTVTVL